jgi:class 3 adenylate cyclase
MLWENLPAEVMDSAIRIHHTIIRKAVRLHRGYESATEGDSFILAFHSAKNAVTFAVDVQRALLDASWPEELLQLELCRPIYVSTE